MEKKPRKSRSKSKTKPKLAEVVRLREPCPHLIAVLQEMLEEAETGELTSLVACITVNGEDEIVFMNRPDQPVKVIGNLEIIKAELLDCIRSMQEEM